GGGGHRRSPISLSICGRSLEEVRDRHVQHAGCPEKQRGTDPVLAALVLLDLLEGDAECIAKLCLRKVAPLARPPGVAPNERLELVVSRVVRGHHATSTSLMFSACDRPRSFAISKLIVCPSCSVSRPARFNAVTWTKMSLPPSLGAMKP